jgi:branched-chain amino acid transport system ATP-binding protein
MAVMPPYRRPEREGVGTESGTNATNYPVRFCDRRGLELLLEVEGVDVHYGAIQALRGVSLAVDEGEVVALAGANGAGKTTTLRAISGMVVPTRGLIRFGGEEIQGRAAYEVVGFGIAHLAEGRELFPGLSVLENLKLGYWAKRKDKAGLAVRLDTVMQHFPRLGERAGQAAGTLSGGEQQMLGVARALMSSPRLLIVDELSLGLAPMIVAQLFQILDEINRAGTAVLLVEQFVHLAFEHAHRAYVLQKGQVVLEGTGADLLADPALVATYLGEAAGPIDDATKPPPRPLPAPRPPLGTS